MKKRVYLFCSLMICLVLAGCGRGSETPGTSNAATTAAAGDTIGTAGVTAAADATEPDTAGTEAAETEPVTAAAEPTEAAGTTAAAEPTEAVGTTAAAELTEAADATEAAGTDSESDAGSLKVPEIEWWEVYDPNGFDTFSALVYNPNDVDVDFSYEIVFLKDGNEVGRLEYGYNDCIPAGGRDIIWDNSDIPKASEVDDIRVENVSVYEAFYPSIRGSFEFDGVKDGYAYYNFTFDQKPTLATIWFLLYNDNNGNAAYDKGEIAVMSFTSMTEQTGSVYYETDVIPATNCEVFFKAY